MHFCESKGNYTVLLNIATELEENKICNCQNKSSHHGLLALIFFSWNWGKIGEAMKQQHVNYGKK